jgi:hypothetical protein
MLAQILSHPFSLKLQRSSFKMKDVVPDSMFSTDHVPSIDDILPDKNHEKIFVHPDEDDYMQRKWIKAKFCPFASHSKCSRNSWDNACCWSLKGTDQMLKYVMQHGTESGNHKIGCNEAYTLVLEALTDPNWLEVLSDDWEDREKYRASVSRAKNQIEGKVGAKRKHQEVKPDDSASNVSGDAAHDTMVQTAIAQGVAQALSQMGMQSKRRGVADWASVGLSGLESVQSLPSSSSTMNLSLPGETIEVPMERLKMMQDSLARAEAAISSSLQGAILNCQKLSAERKIIMNAMNQIAKVTGDEVNFFQG